MNEDNKIFKTNEFSIEISPVGKAIQAKDIQYFSYDENSGLQLIHILMDGKPLDLPNGTEIRLSAVKLNNQNQKLIYTPEIVDPLNGIVSFIIPREFLGYQGKIRCGLYINFSNNQTMHVGYFYIKMGVSDIDTNLTEFTEDFWQGWSEFEAGSTAKMQELEQRIDEQTEIFNNADVYNKAEIEDKLEPFALQTDIDTLDKEKANKTSLIYKVDVSQFNQALKNITTGSPQGIFDSLADLRSNFPTGTSGVYLVKNGDSSDSYIYQNWDWVKIGAYPTVQLSDEDSNKLEVSANAIYYRNYAENGRPTSANFYRSNLSNLMYDSTNQAINFTATAKFGQASYTGFAGLNLNHRIYMRVAVKHSGAESFKNLRLICSYNNSTQVMGQLETVTNEYRYISFLFDSNSYEINYPNVKISDYRDNGFTEISLKHLTLIDVDEIFGSGEVTKSDLDELFDDLPVAYFDDLYNTGVVPKAQTANFAVKAGIADKVLGVSNLFYVRFKGESLSVVNKYSGNQDIVYNIGKSGPNQLMDFTSLQFIENSTNDTSADIVSAVDFWTNTTDCFAPYILQAADNIDGDAPDSLHFTGGKHGYLNNGSSSQDNTRTARTTDVVLKVGGRILSQFEGYANYLELSWTNYIQATNTKKADGSGREVLVEHYVLTFKNGVFEVEYQSEVLEDLTIKTFYGLQLDNKAWQGSLFYNGAANMKKNEFVDLATSCQSKKCDAMTLVDVTSKHQANLSIDYDFGIGDRRFLTIEKGAFSAPYNKVYFNLIEDSTFEKGDCMSFRGQYRFTSLK